MKNVFYIKNNGKRLLTFTKCPLDGKIPMTKRSFDIIISSILLMLFLPFMLLISFLIKITSEGSILFRQRRVGLKGKHFTLYKFRTMLKNAEALKGQLKHMNVMEGPVFKIYKDPRTTWIGRFLRRTSLDELPQFFNVLRGDMSIVGPRPPLPLEVNQYEEWQMRRLSVSPGLTCLWQVNGRNKINNFNQWVELDLQYIDNWSLLLDFKIFIKTIYAVLSGRGAS